MLAVTPIRVTKLETELLSLFGRRFKKFCEFDGLNKLLTDVGRSVIRLIESRCVLCKRQEIYKCLILLLFLGFGKFEEVYIMIKRIACTMFAMMFSLSLTAESLYVFVPTEVRANVMQTKIGELCNGVEVTVFGRAKDFRKQVKGNPPTAILSLSPVIEASDSFNTVMKGVKKGQDVEDYVLVSVDKPLEVGAIGTKRIGVVDLLGRKPMEKFVSGLLETKVKLKRVTKVEDLLPLLTFGSVQGIFVPTSLYDQLKSKSNLNLIATTINVQVGLASAALSKASSKEKVMKCISAFDKELNATLGVEQWRTL
ncbi:hypothetical protein [Pleionea sp. CnH1-48]|uniref:hypothetical protein n=1 Tax=Pleionea sp. CnH1-48 TaxID=2954494 RepID=UPI0020979F51|nr:hypothetical protein [Pleionea sp. CnH1-48]MCO7223730.1 hypothetical protein [Pleionea sp. CnH1-48]